MIPQPLAQTPSKEGLLSLAIASFQRKPSQSLRALAAAYNVPRSTLQTRLQGVTPKRETTAVNQKLSSAEEQSLVH